MFSIQGSPKVTVVWVAGLFLCSSIGGKVWADDSGLPPASSSSSYEPPKTPGLYEQHPDGPGQPVQFPTSFYISPSVSFGQSKSGESQTAASVAHSFQVEGGRRAYLQKTRLVDASLLLWTGQMSDTLSDLTGLTGFMARVGYGYRIGQDIWGTMKIGAGLVSGDYSGKTVEGYDLVADEAASGSVLQAAFYLANQLDQGIGFFGGVRHSVYNFDLGTVKVEGSPTVDQEYGKGIVFHTTDIEVGMQFAF